MDKNFMANVVKLLEAAIDAAKDEPYEKEIAFTCPLCGEDAFVARARSDGHHHVHCPTCGIQMAE